MTNFAILASQLNNAVKRGRSSVVMPTNKFIESILSALHKHQFISSFCVDQIGKNVTIYFRYKAGHGCFSEVKLFSTPSRMLPINKHRLSIIMRKRFQEYFFFTTPKGVKVYTFFDLFFLKESVSLGFLLFSVRI